jgi:hypothetical protein
MDMDTLSAILGALGAPKGYIPLTVILIFSLSGIAAHVEALIPQALPTSPWWFKALRTLLDVMGGNYNNAANKPSLKSIQAALILAETSTETKVVGPAANLTSQSPPQTPKA